MRAAPCGLYGDATPEMAFAFGSDLARITHHHPEDYIAAGVFAALIASLRDRIDLTSAVQRALGLAIAVYCALAAQGDFATGVRLAVNHSGDSDSTGAICGNILGAALGVNAIPSEWLEHIEAREIIVQLADDLATGWRTGADWSERYPPN